MKHRGSDDLSDDDSEQQQQQQLQGEYNTDLQQQHDRDNPNDQSLNKSLDNNTINDNQQNNEEHPSLIEENQYFEDFDRRQALIEQEVRSRNEPAMKALESDIAALSHLAKQAATTKEQLVDIRVKQLSITKILVMIYDKGEEALVKANYNAGVAYLDYKCYESALYHLNLAKIHQFKIDTIHSQTDKSRKMTAHILTQLAKCSLELENFEDCFAMVDEALSLFGKESLDCVPTLKCQHKCYAKMKNYTEAQAAINRIYEIQTKNNDKAEAIAMTNVEKAKIFALQNDYLNAIQDQVKAIESLIEKDYDDPDYIAGLLLTLSGYQQQADKVDDSIESLQKVKSIFNQIYGFKDKRLIKVMRQISMILLKHNYYEESITELKEIKKAESQAFGEKSVEVGRTIRIIGTVQILQNRAEKEFKEDIKKNFKEAKEIFENNGLKDLAFEMEQKIKMIEEGETKEKRLKDKNSIINLLS